MLKLYPPGTRKGNRYYIVKGRLGGKFFEVNTKSVNEAAARRIAEGFERTHAKRRSVAKVVSFIEAANSYIQFRSPNKDDRRRIERLKKHLGNKTLPAIVQADLVEAASALYPLAKPSSKNRNVITPASAILHYGAENGWCEWKRIKRFKEPKPLTRSLARPSAVKLIKAATGKKRLLLIALFHLGTRITDTLSLEWGNVDLSARTARIYIKKTDDWRTFPLARDLLVALANETEKEGRVFPWHTRWGAYRALKKAISESGIRFTPHMARHSLGTWLNESGAGLKTIMAALHHADPKSSIRYQDADIEIVRAAQTKMIGRKRLG